jgi:vacuole morphology and inheritance protein 14
LSRKYLSDPTEDVRIAAENQLAEFLREIREVTIVRKHREEQQRLRDVESEEHNHVDAERVKERPSEIAAPPDTDRVSFLNGDSSLALPLDVEKPNGDAESEVHERDIGGALRCYRRRCKYLLSIDWVPGQGVRIDYAAIIEILIQQLDPQRK